MTERRRLRLRCAAILRLTAHVRRQAASASILQLLSQRLDLSIIFTFHLDLCLLQLKDLGPNHLHLLNLAIDLTFIVFGASALAIEFLSHLFQELVQSVGRKTPMLGSVHDDGIR